MRRLNTRVTIKQCTLWTFTSFNTCIWTIIHAFHRCTCSRTSTCTKIVHFVAIARDCWRKTNCNRNLSINSRTIFTYYVHKRWNFNTYNNVAFPFSNPQVPHRVLCMLEHIQLASHTADRRLATWHTSRKHIHRNSLQDQRTNDMKQELHLGKSEHNTNLSLPLKFLCLLGMVLPRRHPHIHPTQISSCFQTPQRSLPKRNKSTEMLTIHFITW